MSGAVDTVIGPVVVQIISGVIGGDGPPILKPMVGWTGIEDCPILDPEE